MSKRNKQGGGARLMEIVAILTRHNAILGVTPDKLRAIVEDLGPTFVKLGQMLSMRPDILPANYCEELQKLRSDVAPMPWAEVVRVVEGSLSAPLHTSFPTFDPNPLGSASIAQVHSAILPGGEQVVVKVQREGIRETMANDIVLLRKAAKLLKLTPTGETIDFTMALDEMWSASQHELDFIHEAENLQAFHRFSQDVAYATCPRVYSGLCTTQVLVMEEIGGICIDDLPALRAQGYDPAEISRKLCTHYMKQILDDGFFHADPHPGNLRILDGQIIWLDLGMAGRLSPKDQAAFTKAIAAMANHDIGSMTDAVLSISRHTQPVHREALYSDIDSMMTQYLHVDIGSMNISELMQNVLALAQRHHLTMPPGITLLARGVSTLEGLVADLSPDVNVMQIFSQRFAHHIFKDIDLQKVLLQNSQELYESIHKSLSTPALLNDALRAALKGELRLQVDTLQTIPTEQAHHMEAHRRTLLICACLIGASLMTLAPIEPTWFGLPWVSVLGFTLSAMIPLHAWVKQKRHH